jgi:hypothetical protein
MNKGWVAAGVAGALLLLLASSSEQKAGPFPFPPLPREPDDDSPAGIAKRELARWQGVAEHDPAAAPILEEYWQSVGQHLVNPDVPWSAAFISYTVTASSTPNAITPSGAHIYFARQAWLDRGVPGRYGAYRPDEVSLEPGDIVLRKVLTRNRKKVENPLKFSDLQQGGGTIPTHSDIVTEVGPSSAKAIGGNMGPMGMSTVKERVIPHQGGVVTDPMVVAVLRYQRPGAMV